MDPASGVAYHSAAGAAAESQHVYLNNSGVAERIQAGLPTDVLEIGWGTGTAMLLTLDLAVAHDTPLHYVAVEQDLISADLLDALQLGRLLEHPALAEQLLAWRRTLGKVAPRGALRWYVDPLRQFTLHHQSARQWWRAREATDGFDAIYFDPFAPRDNPELWSLDFLQQMHQLLKPSGRLVTYCVNRPIRERLQRAGFVARRVPGPPAGKREVLIASPSLPAP